MRGTEILRRGQMLAIALVVGALALGISAPSRAAAAAATTHHTWHVTVGVQTSGGSISGMIFTPSDIFVHRGDTVVWTVGAKEIHTVAFGNPPADTDNEAGEGITSPIDNAFEELIEQFAAPAGGASFDGVSYHNSGIMTTVPAASGFPQAIQQYSLQINAPVGTYNFYCLVHGPMMSQNVHVIADSQAYPFNQEQYNDQAEHQRDHVFAQGRRAIDQTEDHLASHTVSVGSSVDSGQADIMRFIHTNTTIEVGESVTFNNTTFGPHTVTIGKEQGTFGQYGNLNSVHLGDNVSSGVFGMAFGHPSVTFRFMQPGVYHYYCMLHDYEGMVGTITVRADD
ncbi:MAG TPA: plastocyanin/azurin family copper-binding protein [Ktedonobacterales bacterium]